MAGWDCSDSICFLASVRVSFVVNSFSTLHIPMTRSLGASSLFLTLFLTLLLAASLAVAQDRPEEGGRELQVWTGGGPSVAGGTRETSVWNSGARYGWVLTA